MSESNYQMGLCRICSTFFIPNGETLKCVPCQVYCCCECALIHSGKDVQYMYLWMQGATNASSNPPATMKFCQCKKPMCKVSEAPYLKNDHQWKDNADPEFYFTTAGAIQRLSKAVQVKDETIEALRDYLIRLKAEGTKDTEASLKNTKELLSVLRVDRRENGLNDIKLVESNKMGLPKELIGTEKWKSGMIECHDKNLQLQKVFKSLSEKWREMQKLEKDRAEQSLIDKATEKKEDDDNGLLMLSNHFEMSEQNQQQSSLVVERATATSDLEKKIDTVLIKLDALYEDLKKDRSDKKDDLIMELRGKIKLLEQQQANNESMGKGWNRIAPIETEITLAARYRETWGPVVPENNRSRVPRNHKSEHSSRSEREVVSEGISGDTKRANEVSLIDGGAEPAELDCLPSCESSNSASSSFEIISIPDRFDVVFSMNE